jgi:hypothetical protein
MTYFNWENRLTQDKCAQEAREKENREFLEYNQWNFYGDCKETGEKLNEFAAKYPNLRFRKGYGNADACTIDNDTKIKMVPPSHGPEKRTFDMRVFHAVPDLSRGCVAPYTESRLIHGEDTTRLYDTKCHITSEMNFDRFTPLTSCMNDYIKGFADYKEDVRIGINTRESLRKNMKKCKK